MFQFLKFVFSGKLRGKYEVWMEKKKKVKSIFMVIIYFICVCEKNQGIYNKFYKKVSEK